MWFWASFLFSIFAMFVNGEVFSEWPIREFRAVWVATVANIDWPSSSHLTTAQQKQQLHDIVNTVHRLNFNAIVFQVRTSGDAVYNSSLEPWSTYVTGTQGKAPSPFYDPLEFLVQEAHSLGIEVHAWFNPYRARAGSTSRSGLAPNHPANRFPSYTYAYGTNLWMDPGAAVIQDHIVEVYKDVATRYDVDGLHMDDYFYPYPVDGVDFPDSQTYADYKNAGGTLGLADWRRNNVNTLIQRLGKEIHAIKPYLKYGISPFGIWKPGHPAGIRGLSAFDALYADARRWFDEGWLDYLAPQLYWRIEPPQQSYPALLDWWLEQNSHHRHLYTGNYAAAAITKKWGVQELINQVTISRERHANMSLGNIQFSVKYFVNNDEGMADAFAKLYPNPALTPAMSWMNVTVPPSPTNVHVNGQTISWDKDSSGNVMYTVIYKQQTDAYLIYKLVPTSIGSVSSVPGGYYAIRNVNRAGEESAAVYVDVVEQSVIVVG